MSPTPCPFDPELGPLLTAAPPELTATLTPEAVPVLSAAYFTPTQTAQEFIGERPIQAIDYTIPGYQGAQIGITVLSRKDRKTTGTAANRKTPAFYYIHGGGMVMGHRLMNAEFILPWVEQFDGVFATVDHRVAPKHPDPVPVEDCYAGLVWFAGQGETLGFDPARIMIVGYSAGAGIAAGVTLLARDRGGPTIGWQLLAGPMLDDRNSTLSACQYASHGVWNAKSNQTGWSALLGDRRAGPNVSIYAAPSRALDAGGPGLGNLPPTYLDVGSAEVFRDEVVAYANGIWAAGGTADLLGRWLSRF
ncbi:alpha/beta hydrolase domain-containing protein [Xylaria venustula]|nr:alpha/beta hydrolase domain-containing protein [Xylaria venustula]